MKENSPFRLIMLILSIILSVVVVPVIILVTFSGAALHSTMNLLSGGKIPEIVKESDLYDSMLDIINDMASDLITGDFAFTPETNKYLIKQSITSEDLEGVCTEVMNAFMENREVSVDLSKVKTQLKSSVISLFKENENDFFYAWKDDKESYVFSKSLIADVKQRVNDELDVSSEEQLQAQYMLSGKSTPYEEFVYQEWLDRKDEILPDLTEEDFDLTEIFEEAEAKVNASINKEFATSELQKIMNNYQLLKKKADKTAILTFLIVGALVLLLLLLYLFRPAGFFVTAGALFLGGILCLLCAGRADDPGEVVYDLIQEALSDVEYANLATSILRLVMKMIREIAIGVRQMGNAALIFGAILTGGGIFAIVLRKNKKKSEEIVG